MSSSRDKDRTLARLNKSLVNLADRVTKQRRKNVQLRSLQENYLPPDLDVYFHMKVQLSKQERKEREAERKENLQKLKERNETLRRRRQRRPARKSTKKLKLPSPSAKDQVYRGPTFDIVYTVPS